MTTGLIGILLGIIGLLGGAIGFQKARNVRKDYDAARAETERSNYALNMLEKTRKAAEDARALADKELGDPPNPDVPKDFESKR